MILNARQHDADNGLIAEEQGGFRKQRGCRTRY